MPVRASVFAANNIPLEAIEVPPAATACQECAGYQTQVAVRNPAVGTL